MSRPLGHLTIVGHGNGFLPVTFSSPASECAVPALYWGFITELMEVVTLAQAGNITMLVEHFPPARGSETYRLLHGQSQGRAVITPND